MAAAEPHATLRAVGGGVYRIQDTLTLRAPLALAYAVVADFERYPEFINDVVTARSDGETCAMTLRVGPMRIPLTTRVDLEPGRTVRFTLLDGPVTRLEGCWTFCQDGDAVTVGLDAEVDAGRLGAWMARVAGQFADRHLHKVRTAFSNRVAALAGRTADTGRSREP
jgi:ribosome-associated toxin RatA of RatAB toxin-antitoxin module